MLIEKSCTEVVCIHQEIKVYGMSLQKSGLPITFDSLGKLWGLYADKYRGKEKNPATPVVEYAVCLNKIPDYITGCSVTEFGPPEEDCASYVIPTGSYIKDTFCAESFEKLTSEVMGKRNVKAWAKKNNIKIDGRFTVEVYPTSDFEAGRYEMYTLTPILA